MTEGRSPLLVLFSGPETLEGVDRRLRGKGVRPLRIASWQPRPIAPNVWSSRLARRPAPDTVVLTSRTAVECGVRPWRKLLGEFPKELEFWAVGPGTARALRAVGVTRIRRSPSVGTEGLADALRRTPPRRIAYLRSDLAGPRLARRLRASGHRVADVVVYRTAPPRALSSRQRRELLRADLLVVTSPSGLAYLRAALGSRDFLRVVQGVPLVVLGERSRRAALRLRFRRISVAPPTTPQRFTQLLMRELQDAPA